jgi:hypothetical protein
MKEVYDCMAVGYIRIFWKKSKYVERKAAEIEKKKKVSDSICGKKVH